MKLSIEEFVKTGKFGPVQIGMSKPEIIEFLGEADSDNDMDQNGSILIYGWYELFINSEDRLYSIQNDNYDPKYPETYIFQNSKFEIDPWILNNSTCQNIESISSKLKNSGIRFCLEEYYGRIVIKADSGVIIDFEEDENEIGLRELIGIRYWP
ncbi:hypothetical protein [Simiduia aestuariiviva]|uniref:Uncharacterized protein n=1 Tax=Simiduia aestuariiviva TaxID=1510459 RepID=A0A839UN91_9GAMM|nr:hypothetical protein [Simiduia aestuariiviva]MBB3166835.1 hypothetical protein [Simiduia aestuariiviva]